MKGIIYTRVSSDEQVKGTSLEFQEQLCRQHCEQRGIEVLALFREEGESAKDLNMQNRKKFLAALEFCRKNKNNVQAFVVFRIDRFARNTEDHFAVRKILMGYGTSLYSVSEPIGNKPAEKFIETVLAGAAEYENALRKQRCSDGMLAKINQGLFPWRAPLGYKCLNFSKRGEKKTEPDPPDERIFPLIQRALKEYAQGIYTVTELARTLDKRGLNELRGRKTTIQIVDRILGKYLKFYAGIIHNPFTGEDVDGLHKPMITKEEMHQIQLVRSGKARISVKRLRYNPEFPLRKFILCGSCKKPLTGSAPRGKGGRYYYYHCQNKNCDRYGKSMPRKKLESEFSNYLQKITPSEDFLLMLKESVMDVWKEQKQSVTAQKQKQQKRLSLLQEKRKRIFEMREEGSYTKEEFMERKQEVEEEMMSLKISLNEFETGNLKLENALNFAIASVRSLETKWFELLPSLRFRFHKLLFPAGISYENNSSYGTPQLGAILKLNQEFAGTGFPQKSHLVDLLRINWNYLIKELQQWQALNDLSVSKSDTAFIKN
jgi:site-specific DNA recombinase